MKRIVLDTNIFVSALISKRGASYRVLERLVEKAEQGIFLNATSVALILELEEVLFRQENRALYAYLDEDDLRGYVDDVAALSHHARLSYLWRPFLKDKEDDKVLETAFNSGAHAIITHNVRDFKEVPKWFDIEILTPKAYLEKGGLP